MPLLWSQNLMTGLGWQDDQHKELFKRIEKLMDAITGGMGKDEIKELFDFVDNYVIEHFGEEEQEMEKLGFAYIETHKKEHEEYIENYLELKKRANDEGIDTKLLVETQKYMVDWMRTHIGQSDRVFAIFALADKNN